MSVPSPITLPPTGPWTALVADPDPGRAGGLVAALERAGLRAAHATDLVGTRAALPNANCRLVIAAADLADGEGTIHDAVRAVRAEAYVYLMLVDFWATGRARAAGLDAGADDFLVLPLNRDELRARIDVGLRAVEMRDRLALRAYEEQATLAELREVKAAIDRDLEEARGVQRSMLPPADARFGAVSLHHRLLNAGSIGGDLPGYAPLAGGGCLVWSFDVSGHGIASALTTGRLSGFFSLHRLWEGIEGELCCVDPPPPDVLMRKLNDVMLARSDGSIYLTAVFATISADGATLRFCQAGHPHPIRITPDGTRHVLGHGGEPVGLIDDPSWETVEVALDPGDRVLIHTDGLTDCADTWGDMLDDAGLDAILAALPDGPLDVQGDAIQAALDAHSGINGLDDDVSYMLLRRDPVAVAAEPPRGAGRASVASPDARIAASPASATASGHVPNTPQPNAVADTI